MQNLVLDTSHGEISIIDSQGEGSAVILIHGNSSCKEIYKRQLEYFGKCYRIIALDLPGHGSSENAGIPEKSYSISGFADLIIELKELLNIERHVVFGWSLGGHIAIELLARQDSGLIGVAVSGTPPVDAGAEGLLLGYQQSAALELAGQELFSEDDIFTYARALFGEEQPVYLRDVIRRTDGRFRSQVVVSFIQGKVANQRETVANSIIPFAVFNGSNDQLINHEYIVGDVTYGSLWRNKIFNIRQAGHAPFYTEYRVFNSIFLEFLRDIN